MKVKMAWQRILWTCRLKTDKLSRIKQQRSQNEEIIRLEKYKDILYKICDYGVNRRLLNLAFNRIIRKSFHVACSLARVLGRIIITRAIWDGHTVWGIANAFYVWSFGLIPSLIQRLVLSIIKMFREISAFDVKKTIMTAVFSKKNSFDGNKFTNINMELIENHMGSLEIFNLKKIFKIHLICTNSL